MYIDFQHLAALEYFCAYQPADIRRLYRKVLVGSLRFHLERLDTALVDSLQHVLDCSLSDSFHRAFALHRRADGRYSEHLRDLLYYRLLVEAFVCSHEDKTFVALYAHAVEFFEKLLDTFNKHPFEIGFIHSLQCYFAASDYKNMFIIHLSDHLYY